MKIAVCSDLHLEFAPITLENPGDVKVLILSGDILVERDLDEYNLPAIESGYARHKSTMFHTFFEECCANFEYVIYVAGNHEHYHGDYKYTVSELKKKLAHNKNLYILDKECINIDGVMFVGGTLWTNMNNEDPLTLHAIKDMMNDFRCVQNSNREVSFKTFDENNNAVFKSRPARFTPEDAVEDNRACFDYIKFMVENNDKVVVIGHHTPSHQSCHPRYKHDQLMNGGYHNNYEEYIMDHPQIKLWTHGHTHETYDYIIGETRIVCNPRGYKGYEQCAEDFELKVVEV